MIECDSSQEIEFIRSPLPPPPFEKGGCETVDKRGESSKKAVYIYIYIRQKGKKVNKHGTRPASPSPFFNHSPLSTLQYSPLISTLFLASRFFFSRTARDVIEIRISLL